MNKHTSKSSRSATAVKAALAALAIGGGLAIGIANNSPDAVAAQSAVASPAQAAASQAAHTVTLYKSPTCTCCRKWGEHLREAGFDVREVISEDVQVLMDERRVPAHLRSCHLGVVGDYVVVGHVPADLVARLLEEKPEVAGIAVPGMPIGSPGMEAFARKDRYDVTAFGPDGAEYVFANR